MTDEKVPESILLNGHAYVHVAGCPCPEMTAWRESQKQRDEHASLTGFAGEATEDPHECMECE